MNFYFFHQNTLNYSMKILILHAIKLLFKLLYDEENILYLDLFSVDKSL